MCEITREQKEMFFASPTMSEEDAKAMAEKLKEAAGKAMGDAEKSGNPWYLGMFNPEIVKAAFGERKTETESEEERFKRELEENNARFVRHDQIMLEADEVLRDMIRNMQQAGGKVLKTIEENDLTTVDLVNMTDQLSMLGTSMARMRESMNPKLGPIGYGCGPGIV